MDGSAELSDLPARTGRKPIVLAVAATIGAAAVVAALKLFATGLPVIRQADLDAAVERWVQADLRDYRLTVVLRGRQSGELTTEVRDGAATSLVRNGQPVPQPRTWQPWTVPGMFDTLQTDFDNAARADEKFGGGEVVMRCEFDERYGYPKRYLHQILGRHGDLEWTVTKFEELR